MLTLKWLSFLGWLIFWAVGGISVVGNARFVGLVVGAGVGSRVEAVVFHVVEIVEVWNLGIGIFGLNWLKLNLVLWIGLLLLSSILRQIKLLRKLGHVWKQSISIKAKAVLRFAIVQRIVELLGGLVYGGRSLLKNVFLLSYGLNILTEICWLAHYSVGFGCLRFLIYGTPFTTY